MSPTYQPPVPARDDSSLPLWIITCQTASIAQSVAGFKYPVAVLATEVIGPFIFACMAMVSFPYPLAPQSLRPRWITVLPLVATGLAVGLLLNGLQSPFPATDWRRSVILPRPPDRIWQISELVKTFCFLVTIAGVCSAAFSRPLSRRIQNLPTRLPGPFRSLSTAAVSWYRSVYTPCPTSIRVVAEVQTSILLGYQLLDFVPRAIFGVGNGYSTLFGAIPVSYLLLYSDLRTQELGRKLTRIFLVSVILIQIFNTGYKVSTGTYGNGANLVDQALLVTTIVVVIVASLLLAANQWRLNRRPALTTAQVAIDGLFTKTTQAEFWEQLIHSVGPRVGVDTWMWLMSRRQDDIRPGDWQIIARTEQARTEWLHESALQNELRELALHPGSIRVDTSVELPSTLVLLPIYRNDVLSEVLIAVNPQPTSGSAAIDDSLLLGRLMQAINTLRSREREAQIAGQQTQIAAQLKHVNELYRTITRELRVQRFRENLRFSALLHDRVLQQIATLVKQLQDEQSDTTGAQRETFAQIERRCRAIDRELRRIARELRPPGVGQHLRYTFEQAIMEWEQQHPHVQFEYAFDACEVGLDEYQRDSIFMIVHQLVENALKHAEAGAIEVRVYEQNQRLQIDVHDNGCGFTYDPALVRPDALGIMQCQDIAHDLGGALLIATRPGAGCRVTLSLPFPSDKDRQARPAAHPDGANVGLVNK